MGVGLGRCACVWGGGGGQKLFGCGYWHVYRYVCVRVRVYASWEREMWRKTAVTTDHPDWPNPSLDL